MLQVMLDPLLSAAIRKDCVALVDDYVTGAAEAPVLGVAMSALGCRGCELYLTWLFVCGCVAENQCGYVLWKEFMPVFRPLLGLSTGVPTFCGCLITIARVLSDALGWSRNPSFLPIMHERFFQLTSELERAVSVANLCPAFR